MPTSSTFGVAASFLLAVPSVAFQSLNPEALHSLSVGVGDVGSVESDEPQEMLLSRSRRFPNLWPFSRQTSRSITLENFHDVHYSAQVRVGEQDIMAMVDTGAYELMVFDRRVSCIGCEGSTEALFDRRESETLRTGEWTAEHDFLGGHTFSSLVRDNIQVGSLEADQQYFWLVTQAMLPGLELDGFQGILGLAPPGQPVSDAVHIANMAHNASALANASGTPSEETEAWRQDSAEFASELFSENSLLESINVDVFSVCLEPHLGHPGILTLRDDLPDRDDPASAFESLPVAGHETWTVVGSHAALGDTPVGCDGGCAVVFDTATPLISVPQDVFDRVQEALEGLDVDCTEIWNLPTLSLTLGDSVITLPPDTYMGEVFGEVTEALAHFWPNPAVGLRTCRPLLMVFDSPTQWGPLWVMGMPFFRKYYTIFQLGQFTYSPEEDMPDRFIHFARQTGEVCERPAALEISLREESSGQLQQSNATDGRQALLKIDLAKLHPPRWAKLAAGEMVKL